MSTLRPAWFAACLLSVTATVNLASCGRDPRSNDAAVPPARASQVTLVAMGSWWFGEGRLAVEQELAAAFTRQTGVAVQLVPMRESPTESFAQCKSQLENHAPLPDVYPMDVVWPGMLGEYLIDLRPRLAKDAAAHLPLLIENNTVGGRLVAMPVYVNVALLFYRTDLLQQYGYDKPPATWDELESMAAAIQKGERKRGNDNFWGYVWQGAAYEGLTCNALEWQVSHGGGRLIEQDGTINVNNPRAIGAFRRAARWLGTISPPGVTVYREEDARNLWQAGNAAFMRGWPYSYAVGQRPGSPIRDKFGVGVMPSGGASHAATFGGLQLAVSKYSRHPDEAVAFVRHMTSPTAQARRAAALSLAPTILALYEDPEVMRPNPYYFRLRTLFAEAVARPSTVAGKHYDEVSEAYFTAVHSILTGTTDAAEAVAALEQKLVRITGAPSAGTARAGAAGSRP